MKTSLRYNATPTPKFAEETLIGPNTPVKACGFPISASNLNMLVYESLKLKMIDASKMSVLMIKSPRPIFE